jgi:hypothetical protein
MYMLTLKTLDRRVRVDCAEAETRSLLTAAYGHMEGDAGSADLHYTVGRDSARFFIKREGQDLLAAADDGMFLALFDADIAIELQKLRRDLYFVHAAVLTVDDSAFMLVAQSGSGKSTVCWALSHHGFRYLSDELGPVDLKTLRIHPFTRALMLKTNPPANYPLPATTVHTSRGRHVAAADMPGGVCESLARLTAVFFLRYDAEAREPSIRRISAAEAAVRLYADTLNALAHTGEGLDAAIRITTATACFALVSANLTATCTLLADTFKNLPREEGRDWARGN